MTDHTSNVQLNVNDLYRRNSIEWIGILTYRMGRLQADYIKVIRGTEGTFFIVDLPGNMRPKGFPKSLIGNKAGDLQGAISMMRLNTNYGNINWANPIVDFDNHGVSFADKAQELYELQQFAISNGSEIDAFGQCFIAQADEDMSELISALMGESCCDPCISHRKMSEGLTEYFGEMYDYKKAKEVERERVELFHENLELKSKIARLESRLNPSTPEPSVQYTKPNRLSNVYIMKDNHNGLYKIGKSKNPKRRERTLQSEKPSIQMVFNAPESPDLSERTLHNEFADQRCRGEWFALSPAQVRYICHQFNP